MSLAASKTIRSVSPKDGSSYLSIDVAPTGIGEYPVGMVNKYLGVALAGWGILMGSMQAPVVLSNLEIDLWPEYDRPGVLVIYRATIAPGSPLPAPLRFQVPAAVGRPHAVAELQANGELVSLRYDRSVDGDLAVIEFTATRPRVQIEYYEPRIDRDGATRSFAFRWPGDYEVGALSVSAQQPDLAQNLVIDPSATREERGADGLLYRTFTRSAIGPAEVVDVVVSYDKVADRLSVETMQPAEPAAGGPGSIGGAPEAEDPGASYRLIVVGSAVALAASLMLAAAVWFRRRGATAGPMRASGRFCTRCGTSASAGDRFCHRCGAPIK